MKNLMGLLFLVFVSVSCRQAPHQPAFPWKPFSQQAVEESVASKKPVVIDFFAQWCPNCYELDRTVFSRSEIRAKLALLTALRMDVTDQDDPQVQKIIQQYEVEGVPTVIFLDSQGKEINDSRLIGLFTPEEFSQSLALLK